MPLPYTPDGRYFIHRSKAGPRLWRAANPNLDEKQRMRIARDLMRARRLIKTAKGNEEVLDAIRAQVDRAKQALGERGPAWWTDKAPDYDRSLVKNTPYAAWWEEWQRSRPST
ncbi:hypothetical protein G7077_04470 [Sphingomonas piscis]|uniref:Uncharacterized protein n=2 Tax=Sphingomonas piscis TaxID=2714943 RepID=A0A6G7YT62_9SPHN|nr:hypothetical protein G7077_04470 [Sphingomonas piscis]